MSDDTEQSGLHSPDSGISTSRVLVPLDEVVLHPEGPVTLEDREGVFAHSFKCASCQLEFTVMSWKRSRHRADNTYCPECGTVTEKAHWRSTLSQSQDFVDDGSQLEIFNVLPFGDDARLISAPSLRQ